MNADDVAGRLIVASLPGPELSSEEADALAELGPGGVILFSRNLCSPSQVADLIAGVRESARRPLLLAVDQEGGRVNRLRALHPVFDRLPSGRVQAGWLPAHLREVWRAVGRALAAVGFDVDFHPIVDLDDGPGVNAIGDRSFGVDAPRVAAIAATILEGLGDAGVAGCLKHFPGLGGSDLDTHHALATSPLSRDSLWEEHLLPFRRLAPRAPLVMTAHAHYPAIDGTEPLPATFSRTLVTGWLRQRIGFEGLIVSDDLEMGAVVAAAPGPAQRATRALAAGCDLALFCHGLDAPRRARDEIARRLARGELDPHEVAASRTRLDALLARQAARRAAPASTTAFLGACDDLAAVV